MKNFFLFIFAILCFVQPAFSQVKIVPGGNVVMSRPLDPSGWVLVGETETNYPILSGITGKFNVRSYNAPSLILDYRNSSLDPNIWPHASMAQSNKLYAKHWITMFGNSHNSFSTSLGLTYAKGFAVMSDENYKTDIEDIDNALAKVLQLRGVTYRFNAESYCGDDCPDGISQIVEDEPLHYGFISQEVEDIIPEIVRTIPAPNDVKAMNYIEIIPLLVESIQTQQAQINELEEMISACCNMSMQNNSQDQNTSNQVEQNLLDDKKGGSINEKGKYENNKTKHLSCKLYQNVPNPFNSNTVINFETPANINNVAIYIYDMQGKQIKAFKDLNKGKSALTIHANELLAGMYLYALIVDGAEVATKRMVLTN
jgi:hypothetical protein